MPTPDYDSWSATCDTLHAHTQVLGKLAATLAPPEPQLQHAALQLTARGYETRPLPCPDGSGVITVGLDLRGHEHFVEHSDGATRRGPLGPDRAVADVCGEILAAVSALAGTVAIDPTPQEVTWTMPLDEDREHATYDVAAVGAYFQAATVVAAGLAAFRAPYRGRSTPVNAWWGSFDLSVSLFSGLPATPPSDDFLMRNAMDAEEVAVGWWPGDSRYGRAALYAYAHPASEAFAGGQLSPGSARWAPDLGEYLLDWEAVVATGDPRATVLQFAQSAFAHACSSCSWDGALAATAQGNPPPLR